jgi:Phospholipase_D-nuclease N-terminal
VIRATRAANILTMPARKKRWADLSTGQKRAVVAAGVVQNSLLIAALVDLRRRPAKQINGDKRLWAAASFINFVGPIAYFIVGRKR